MTPCPTRWWTPDCHLCSVAHARPFGVAMKPRPKAVKRRDPEPADLSAARTCADREVKS